MGQRTFQFVSYQSLKRDTFITLDYNFMKMERRHLNWWNIAHQLQSLLCPQYLWEQFYFILGVIVQPWNYSALTNNAYFTHMPTRAGCESLFISISYQKFRSSNSFATVARCVFFWSAACIILMPYHIFHRPAQAVCESVALKTPRCTSTHSTQKHTQSQTSTHAHKSKSKLQRAPTSALAATWLPACFAPSISCGESHGTFFISSTQTHNTDTGQRPGDTERDKVTESEGRREEEWKEKGRNPLCVLKHTLWNEKNQLIGLHV